MTVLAPSTDYTGAAVTQGGKKTFVAAMRAFLADTLGTDSGAGPVTAASAATVNLDAVTTVRDVVISGTTAITAFTIAAGKVFRVRASGAFTLTNNAAIVTQAGADIVAAAGDTFILRATAANVVEVLMYSRSVPSRSARIDVASSAGTVNLTTAAPGTDDIRITGALAITAFTVAVGRVIRVVAGGAFSLANNASIVTQTGGTLLVQRALLTAQSRSRSWLRLLSLLVSAKHGKTWQVHALRGSRTPTPPGDRLLSLSQAAFQGARVQPPR